MSAGSMFQSSEAESENGGRPDETNIVRLKL